MFEVRYGRAFLMLNLRALYFAATDLALLIRPADWLITVSLLRSNKLLSFTGPFV